MGLIKQASEIEMQAKEWGLDEWFAEQVKVEQRKKTSYANDPKLTYLPGDLRESLIRELSFKSISEYEATKALLLLADKAPDSINFDYMLTQIFDEGRHAKLFREHLVKIGFADINNVASKMESLLRGKMTNMLETLRTYFDKWVVLKNDYIAGVLIITVVLEGVLAPTSELSEIKWRPFDIAAAETQARANADELRHLTVCANMVKTAIENDHSLKQSALECIEEGLALWNQVSVDDLFVEREMFYQRGMQSNLRFIEGYELAPGVLLSESTVESRLELSHFLVEQMQQSRLEYMGLV
ncbi:hypothetical protein Ppb6_03379 [Photorhabdus australis subsp. thailandensis]|uniref:Uncharacterized protein n=1 Tax=Photorhabdus australis subsp. thailandensis TaxID=2805096 RepID=A0A1C0U0K9_9GAMM|nr:hypothetical protein [Photorhabdus australis]OCQ51462.1 hypothetical protein Ppb6_03379 [Photorhabdus australis subsp. thailandensis]